MDTVHNLEKTVAEWYKNVPHLPKDLRKWLGENVWWLVIIGVVLSVFAVISTVGALLLVLGLASAVLVGAGIYGGAVAAGLTGFAWLVTLLALVSLLITTILMAMAISPLKAKAKKGWTLLFIVLLVSLVLNAIGALVSFNLFSLFWTVVWAAVEAYFLFEIRGEFGKAAVKSEAKATKK